jgi:hypothetical protein
MIENKTAYHEAGHAIIAFYHGFELDKISTKYGEKSIFVKSIVKHHSGSDIYQLEQELDVLLAGKAVEDKLLDEDSSDDWMFTDLATSLDVAISLCELDQDDDELIDEYLKTKEHIETGSPEIYYDADTFIENYGWHSEELVNRNHIWKCIDHLAQMLMTKGEIEKQELLASIKIFWNVEDVVEIERSIDKERIKTNSERQWGMPF